jgi:C-terminal processing protease CtpA/Prc
MISRIKIVLSIVAFSFLTACGGDRSHSTPQSSLKPTDVSDKGNNSDQSSSSAWIPGEYPDWRHLADVCANPIEGEMQGTITDENAWIRSYSHDTYLWYRELEDIDPASVSSTAVYFNLMKTSAKTSQGRDKDEFHYYEDIRERSVQQAGYSNGYRTEFPELNQHTAIPYVETVSVNNKQLSAQQLDHLIGYGAKFLWINKQIIVAYVEADSPASRQKLSRGAIITAIDGDSIAEIIEKDSYQLDAILLHPRLGESHTFEVKAWGAQNTRHIKMKSDTYYANPVKNRDVIVQSFGDGYKKIGYLTFNAHNEISEQKLRAAFTDFLKKGIDELVLDLRYNRGGIIKIAAQLGYMIAGDKSQEKIFAELQWNDKHSIYDPITQHLIAPILFNPSENTVDQSVANEGSLPTLNFDRVFVLAGKETASASEALINGLRGLPDFNVVLIGETTRGKPYGFHQMENCGIRYSTIQARIRNARGFSDYANGLVPVANANVSGAEVTGCKVADDFSSSLGNPSEERFAAAISYINDGGCPESSISAIADDGFILDRPDRFQGILIQDFE